MTKLILLLARRPEVSVAEFHRHWSERHRPLVASLPGIRRLVLNHVTRVPGGDDPAFDGVAESWWDDPAALGAAFASPEAQLVAADAVAFIDLARLRQLVVEEDEEPIAAEPMVAATAGRA
jgi:uncharacterized protein (TIGR02118 family)